MLTEQERATLQKLVESNNVGYLTAKEGTSLAEKEMILVNANQVSPDDPAAFFVQVTDAGYNEVTAPVVEPIAAQVIDEFVASLNNDVEVTVEPTITNSDFSIDNGVAIPKIKRAIGMSRKRKSKYPFEDLEENQSFHVAQTAEDMEPWKAMASNVGEANTRSAIPVEPVEMVTVTRRKAKKVNGEFVLDADGKRVYDSEFVQEQKMIQTKKFIARRVDATDPNGPGCRVFRVPLNFVG